MGKIIFIMCFFMHLVLHAENVFTDEELNHIIDKLLDPQKKITFSLENKEIEKKIKQLEEWMNLKPVSKTTLLNQLSLVYDISNLSNKEKREIVLDIIRSFHDLKNYLYASNEEKAKILHRWTKYPYYYKATERRFYFYLYLVPSLIVPWRNMYDNNNWFNVHEILHKTPKVRPIIPPIIYDPVQPGQSRR